ncbi:MAG TPA: glycosyltransferase [Acidimicrobiales bacterium]
MTRPVPPVASVTAIVVHRDQPDRCAETVRRLGRQGVGVCVVVVDNASTESAVECVRALPGVDRVVQAGGNLGFGGGANAGLRAWLADPAAGEWAVVLPHDALPEDACLERMLDAVAGRPRAGMACAEFGDDEKPVVDPYFGGMTVRAERGEGWEPAGFAHGTLLLVRRACLADVGLFEEDYFAYCEEADLSIRATRAGWEVGMVWGAVVTNPHQGSPPPLVDYLMVRNTVVLVRRHFGLYNATIRFLMAAGTTVWLTLRPSKRTPWFDTRARVLALRDVVLGRQGPPPASLTAAPSSFRRQ